MPTVGNKYKIFDAKTGVEKKGKYFCLRIDANDPQEMAIVKTVMCVYASMHKEAGNTKYANSVLHFIGE